MEKVPQKSITELLAELKSQKEGLSDFEVGKRLKTYHHNTIKSGTSISFLKLIFKQFSDFLILLLIFASALSFALGDSRNGIIIGVIVVVNGIISFTQEYRAQRIVKALNKLLPQMVRVKRSGGEKLVNASSLIPGDIVILGQGDKVPADIRLIESYDLKVDEKILTGESHTQNKDANFIAFENTSLTELKNTLFMGTMISSGESLGLVVNTGTATAFGKIAQTTTSTAKNISPLQAKTAQMSKRLAILALFVVIILIFYKYFLENNLLDAVIFSIAVAAALVPEGLPAAITIALSLGARNLAKKNSLVKNLVSVETLGSVTVICTDKTGTLTTGIMSVNEIWFDPSLKIKDQERKKLAVETLTLCNSAKLGENNVGDPMEIALLKWVENEGFNLLEINQRYRKIQEIPFNSKIRCMISTYRDGGRTFSFTKGAPEVVMCQTHLSQKEKGVITQKVNLFAAQGFRVLALAYNDIFLGLVSIYDPPRREIKKAIADCRTGHIRTIMITGDNPVTAKAIAKMTEITFDDDPQVILGEEINKMSDTKLRSILLDEPIFARALPEHKFRIVDNLIKMGEVVAVTGDGVNDAPALKHANIGVAMGINGTDVSREAADMILLDNNFATIVAAVEEGRAIYDNIKKLLFFILAHNFGELLIILIGMFFGLPLPLLAVQILAIDLGTDALPSAALVFEPAEGNVIKTKPRSHDATLLNKEGFFHLIMIGLIVGFGAIWNFVTVLSSSGYRVATTASLITIVVTQIIFVFMARCPNITVFKYPWKNNYLVGAALFSLALILTIVYSPFLNEWIMTARVSLDVWLRAFLVAAVLFVFEEIYKAIKIRYNAGNEK